MASARPPAGAGGKQKVQAREGPCACTIVPQICCLSILSAGGGVLPGEDQIEKNYQDIGLIIYNRYLNGEAFDENLAGICKDITDLEKEIADCKEDVANKRGRIVCPACGASVPKDAAFCMRCGAAMPEKEDEPEDAEFVHVEPEEKAEETEAAAPEEEPKEEPEKEAEVPEEE